MRTMEHPVNGNGNGNNSLLSNPWLFLFGIMAGVAKFFDNYLLADSFTIATLKAGVAAGFVILCGGVATVLNNKIIKPWLEKKIEKYKNKNKPS